MKKLRKIITIFCLIIIYVYFCNIYNFPSKIIVKENSKLELKLCPFINFRGITQTSTGENNDYKLELSIAGIKIKELDVDIIEDIKLVPVGQVIGIKLYTDGVMIVGVSEIEDINGNIRKSVDKDEIKEGDRIVSINNIEINNIQDLKNEINKNINEIILQIEDLNGNIKDVKVTPIQTSKNEYKIGLWVKDAATGVGTMTYYNKETGEFAALGHGIIDQDTEQILEIDSGEITNANIISINKAIPGTPGEIRGSIVNEETVGSISKNTKFGIFGILNSNDIVQSSREIDVALRNEIKLGKAYILCSLDGDNVQEYEIEITEIYLNNDENNKSFEIKIVDEELKKQTGGIIRGLSRKSNNSK